MTRGTIWPMASTARRSLVLVLATLILPACSRNGSGEGDLPHDSSNFSQRDSVGISITETETSVATAPLRWEIDSVPALALGSEDREAEVFFGVRGLRGLPGGGVLVLDGGSQELRFFDSSGHLTHRVGRKGEGPGEFQQPYLVQTLIGDSLLVWDGGLRRFQLFSAAGEFARTISLQGRWPSGGNPPLGAVGSLMLAYRPEFIPLARRWVYGPRNEKFDFLWHDPATGIEVEIASFSITTTATVGRSGNVSVAAGIPFTTRPSATVTESSALVYDGLSPEIREHGVDGGVRRIFRVTGGFRRPVDAEAIEGYFQYTLSGTPILTAVR